MPSDLSVTLTDELRRYVDARVGDSGIYTSADEFIRDLIRRDMDDWAIVSDIAQGLREAQRGEYAEESILEILNEE